jgi:signal transduction histidine kinase
MKFPATFDVRLFLLTLFYSCSVLFSYSQSANIDSLKHALSSVNGNARADLLNGISKEYWFGNRDSSMFYAGQALLLATGIHYNRAEAEAYRNMGMGNLFADTSAAKNYFYKALHIFADSSDKKGIADTYNNLGKMFSESAGNYNAALVCFDSSLAIFREIGDKKGEGAVLNYINIVYKYIGDYQKAVDYALMGLDIRKATNDDYGIMYSLINVAYIYFKGDQLQSALKFYKESIAYATQHNLKPLVAAYYGLGETYLQLKQYDEAKKWLLIEPEGVNHFLLGQLYYETGRFDSALAEFNIYVKASRENKDIEGLTRCMIGLSKIYLRQNNLELSMRYAKQAYHLADSAKYRAILADASGLLSILEEKAGRYKNALFYSNQSHFIFDSVNNKANESYQQKLAAFESKNEIEKQQANVKILSAEKALQEQKLNSEKLYREIILIASIVLLLLAFLIIRNINSKRKKIQLQKDQIDWEKTKTENAYEELKATQSQLVRREKMASLGELTAGIAHEIQNPLNFVNNFSEVSIELVEELRNEENNGKKDGVLVDQLLTNITQNLEKIAHHGRRADAIVKGMLQHSRSSSGKKEPTDLNQLLDEYTRLAYHGLRAKDKSFNVKLTTDLDPTIGLINIVADEVGRVILNIINNAFYAVSEKKRKSGEDYEPIVSVTTKLVSSGAEQARNAELRIWDNGIGIGEKILDKIYYPFFTTKPTGQGTGLGLSLSYDIITKGHNGNIRVNTRENEFAEFIIDLPIQ